MFDERSGGEDISVLEVPKVWGIEWIRGSEDEQWDAREYTVKSEMTWVRSGRPIYHHLSQNPRTIPFPSGQEMRFGLYERAL